jgi:O-antigen/teichoic acid export membrane protein
VWLVTGGGWAGRGIQILAQLVSVRILTEGLGTSGYGAFAVLAGLQGWFLLADLGIGISIQNYLSENRARDVPVDDILFTGAILSLGAVGTAAAILYAAGPFISDFLLNDFQALGQEERTTAFYAVAFPGVGTALGGVIYKIWFAEHRGYLSQLLPAVGAILGTLAVWGAGRALDLSVTPALLLYYAPLAILPMLALALTVAHRTTRKRFRRDLVRPILTRGLRFWIFGVLQAGVLQVDYIIIARVLGDRDVVLYSLASRLFSLILFLYSALLMALWPVFVEAITKGDRAFIFAMVRRYLAVGFAISLAGGTFVALFRDQLVGLLAPSLGVAIPITIIVLLTAGLMVRTWTDMFAMTLQCMNDLHILWIVVPIQSALSIVLQTWGAKLFGLPGMIAGLVTCFVLTVSWVLPLRFFTLARRVAPPVG